MRSLVAPRYGSSSLAELLPAAIAAVTGDGADLLTIGNASAVIVLVVDGLGADLLERHAGHAPFLTSHPRTVIDAAFPSTTATSLATIGTGRPPGQHGLVGFTMGVPDADHPLNLLSWRVGLRGGGRDARESHVPEALQPRSTALERAAAAGVATTVVLHPDFLDSGLTRAALRGGQRLAEAGLEPTLRRAFAAARAATPSLVYTHHGDLDTAGHGHGPGSDVWCDALAALDRALERTATELPDDTLLLVTADHGMVTVPDEDVFELAEAPELLEGVRVLAGEPRTRHLHTEPGEADAVLERWSTALDDRAVVVPREEAIHAGWFGPLDPALEGRIGDVVVVAVRGSVAHHRVDPHHGRQLGQHGGLSRSELEVPLVRIGPSRGGPP